MEMGAGITTVSIDKKMRKTTPKEEIIDGVVVECGTCGLKGLSRDKKIRLIDLVRFCSHVKTICGGDRSRDYVFLGKNTE